MDPVLDKLLENTHGGDGCWEWQRARSAAGYGVLRIKQKNHYAHRLMYEKLVGPIPDGLTIDHLCRNRGCLNPAHLEVVTGGENTLRGDGPTARHARQTHCVHGHEFTPENTRISRRGNRVCRTCHRERERKRGRS